MSPKRPFLFARSVDVKMLLAPSFRAKGLTPPAAAELQAAEAATVPSQPLPGCLRWSPLPGAATSNDWLMKAREAWPSHPAGAVAGHLQTSPEDGLSRPLKLHCSPASFSAQFCFLPFSSTGVRSQKYFLKMPCPPQAATFMKLCGCHILHSKYEEIGGTEGRPDSVKKTCVTVDWWENSCLWFELVGGICRLEHHKLSQEPHPTPKPPTLIWYLIGQSPRNKTFIHSLPWRGEECATPKSATLTCWLFWIKVTYETARRTLWPPLSPERKKKISPLKGIFSEQKGRGILSPETGKWGSEGCVNKLVTSLSTFTTPSPNTFALSILHICIVSLSKRCKKLPALVTSLNLISLGAPVHMKLNFSPVSLLYVR